MNEVLEICKEKNWTLADYVYEHEQEVKPYLEEILAVMRESLMNGLARRRNITRKTKLSTSCEAIL